MAEERINFTKEDIGAEILPILTSGLYKETLDALREYIQNAIDAKCTCIKIRITPDVITLIDDGLGMTATAAKNAMRFGISDKNPKTHVGFRGIGIYSSFHLCQTLEIFTKSDADPNTYKIIFDFEKIRNDLLKERELRKNGNPPSLYLEKLLEKSIHTKVEHEFILESRGTTVVLSGLLPEAHNKLNNWDEVSGYLQNVVPLPFNPEFRWKEIIENQFTEKGFHFTPINLQIGSRQEELFRPYKNDLFKNKELYPPIIREITDGQRQFGFIWYCVNNARNTIKNESVRGILIKAKGGFSIADRKYLEPYFGRPVISRRITGELIVNNDDLVPNAARSDFENNSTRQAFLEVMPKTIREIDKVVNNIQEKEKARETLKNIYSFLLNDINNKLVAYQRDYDRLLKFNSTIDSIREWLVEHKTTLEEIEPDAIKITCDLLEGCQNFISEALNSEKKTREKLENQIVETVQRESEQSPTSQTDQTISSLHDVVEELGITEPNNYNRFIDYLDSLIKELLETNDYLELLLELRSHLEENP